MIDPKFFTWYINFIDSIDLNNKVISYSATNNINGNCYGNGGIKIWPLTLLENMQTHENSSDPDSVDFDLEHYLELNKAGSTTVINSSSLQAWRAGIREGYKLCLEKNKPVKDTSGIDWRNFDRLYRWLHVGQDVENGLWAIYGARMGMYLALVSGYDNSTIRDFNKLNELYTSSFTLYHDRLLEECNRLGRLIQEKTKDKRITDVLSSDESKQFRENVKPILRSPENFIEYKYHPPYDVVFISYNEPNSDRNFERLLEKVPKAKRMNGVKGIENARVAAAKLCDTDYFWVVESDAKLSDNFEFEFKIDFYEPEASRVWRSKNPVNDLISDYGGVRLLPRSNTILGGNKPLYPIIKLSNTTEFNIDPFSAWRSAFRECTRLASNTIENTQERLDTWCNVANGNYSKYVLDGAKLGRQYGLANKNDSVALAKINDFDWLKEQYDKFY
jgi:hypothetical protein